MEHIWQTSPSRLHRFIQQRVGEASSADDLLQEVLLRVLTRLDALQDQHRPQSWLYHITRHGIVAHRDHQAIAQR